MTPTIVLDAPPRRRDWRGVAILALSMACLGLAVLSVRLAWPEPPPAEGPYRTAEACVQPKKVKR